MKFKNKITKELLTFIPGGAHTYSRGPDTYPSNAPAILEKGKGVYIFDEKGKKYTMTEFLDVVEKLKIKRA